jgi:DNA-directed RNA polymerase subunit RPC12/RpoP
MPTSRIHPTSTSRACPTTHIMSAPQPPAFTCSTCGRQYQHSSHLRRHEATRMPSFPSPRNSIEGSKPDRDWIARSDLGSEEFKCQHCGKAFRRRYHRSSLPVLNDWADVLAETFGASTILAARTTTAMRNLLPPREERSPGHATLATAASSPAMATCRVPDARPALERHAATQESKKPLRILP